MDIGDPISPLLGFKAAGAANQQITPPASAFCPREMERKNRKFEEKLKEWKVTLPLPKRV
ncbi:MAG: hypothetical protein ABI162_17520 [Luteolibacter sp.]